MKYRTSAKKVTDCSDPAMSVHVMLMDCLTATTLCVTLSLVMVFQGFHTVRIGFVAS